MENNFNFIPEGSSLLNPNITRANSPYTLGDFSSADFFNFTPNSGNNSSIPRIKNNQDFGSLGNYLGIASTGASIASDLIGAYGALKQANLAKRGLNFAVDSFNQNTGFKVADYNRRIVDKQNARINSTSPGAGGYQSLADFKDANLLKVKPISV